MSLPTCTHLPSTWHGIPAKAFQVSLPAVHLPRNSRKSVPGVTFCLPPATVSPQKCVRCHLLPSTWHGIPAKAFQVSFSASHLPRNPRKSVPCSTSCLPPAAAVPLIIGCRGFSAGHVDVFSMKRVAISTPAAVEYMHLSENHDIPKKVQLQVSHVWTHLQ